MNEYQNLKMKVRISKRLQSELPGNVWDVVQREAQERRIFTITLATRPEGTKFYAQEGGSTTVVIGKRTSKTVEMVAAHNLGAAGLAHDIGAKVAPPEGAWVIQTYYYDRYYMEVTHITVRALP